jgi:hypothetical protein
MSRALFQTASVQLSDIDAEFLTVFLGSKGAYGSALVQNSDLNEAKGTADACACLSECWWKRLRMFP